MKTTQDAFKKIIELICSSGVAVSDIEKALSQLSASLLFDLAVKENGGIKRVHFAQFLDVPREKIVGIYLFKTDDRYLELEEKSPTEYKIFPWTKAKDSVQGIPDEHDFKRINQLLGPLNVALKNLAAKSFDHQYVIRSFGGGYEAVVTFNWRKDMYPLDWYAPKVRRYLRPENYQPPYQGDNIEVKPGKIKKEDAIQEIIQMMVKHGIAVYDIKRALPLVTPLEATFDLLVVNGNGEFARVPFDPKIAPKRILGLYPFKDEDKVLDVKEYQYELDENDYHTCYSMDNEDLRRFNNMLSTLNSALIQIGAKPLHGKYFLHRRINTVKCPWEACTADIAFADQEPKKVRHYWDLAKDQFELHKDPITGSYSVKSKVL